jgi:long-chain acyl-CoA synthetase
VCAAPLLAEGAKGAELAGVPVLAVMDGGDASITRIDELALSATPIDALVQREPDDTAVILYTSGTTGRAKGAELTHANLLANAKVPHQLVGLGAETVALVALPLFHAFGMTVMHNAVLAVGGTLVLLPRFTAGDAAALIARHRVTFFGGVPTMYIAINNFPEIKKYKLSSVKACISGAAPATRAVRL